MKFYKINKNIVANSNILRNIVFGFLILCFALSPLSSVFAQQSTFTTSLTTTGLTTLPPSVPTNLTATASSDTQIDLSWTASTPNYYPMAGYRIFRDSVFLATTTSTIYSDTGLTPVTTYVYTVEGFDTLIQLSGQSDPATSTTQATPIPSTPPSGGGGAGGSSGNQIMITDVNIIPSTNEATITFKTSIPAQVRVQWGFTEDYEMGSIQSIFYGTDHSQNINGLSSGLNYKVKITAVGNNGALAYYTTSFATVLPVTELGPLPNPSNFFAEATDKVINLSWNNPEDPRFNDVRIVRTEGFFPIDQYDGQSIYEGDGESFVDKTAEPGVTYYYAIFARDREGQFSSGALAEARIAKPGEIIIPTEGDPFLDIPESENVDPMIKELTLADFEFIQDGKLLAVVGSTVAIDGGKNLTIRLKYDKVPEILKTVAFTLQDPSDTSKVFPFLLRINSDKSYYESTIGALGKSGRYGMSVVILDYENKGLKRLNGTLAALVFYAPIFDLVKDFDIFGFVLFLFLIILLVIAVMLVKHMIKNYDEFNRRTRSIMDRPNNLPVGKIVASIAIIVFLGFAYKANSAFNSQINYQGKLVDSSNAIVADGNYNMRFKLYTTRTGGSPIWTETWCNTSNCAGSGTGTDDRITVTNGLFSTMLGSTTAFTGVDFNQTLYLGVEIGGSGATASWDGEMSPRKIIGAVPAAFVAETANTLSGLNSTQFFRTDAQNATSSSSTFLNVLQSGAGKIAEFFGSASQSVMALLSNGNVGIGTTTPYAKLSVAGEVVGRNFTATSTTATSSIMGALGIGTTNPGSKLEVVGDIISKGTSWTARSAAEANSWASVTYGNGLFVAVSANGTNGVMTSPDGINWTARSAVTDTWRSVTYGNGMFVAVSNAWGGANPIMTSSDGINWVRRSTPYTPAGYWSSITYGNGKFVAVSESNSYPTYSAVLVSPDGINWQEVFVPFDSAWESVTYGNGTFVAVSYAGVNQVMTSPDGINWTARSATAPNSWFSVTYGNGLFVAVSTDGTNRVMTSPDGINWTARSAAEANSWNSVTYGNGLFVAVSSSGTNRVMTSPDGITWTARSATQANSWSAVTYGNGTFVAVSSDGTNRVMTSGKNDQNVLVHNNTYQGGMNIFGNVGIGTTTPYSKLSIWGSSTGTNRLFELTNSASTTLASFLENGTGYFLGNIGIGTTSPNWKLSVAGIGSFDDYVRASYFTATSTTATSTLPNLSLTRMLFGSDYLTDITGTGLTVSNGALTVTGATISGAANMLAGFDASGNLTSTSSPQVAYINATSTTATSTFAGGISGPGSFTVQSGSGWLGIGTTTPISALQVTDATNGSTITYGGKGTILNGDTVGALDTYSNDQSVSLTGVVSRIKTLAEADFISSQAKTSLVFQTNTGVAGTLGEVMRLTSAGNVGIGTTTPDSRLTVNADQTIGGAAAQIRIRGATNPKEGLRLGFETTDNYAFLESVEDDVAYRNLALNPRGGSVGISTTTPYAKLSVTNTGSGPSFIVEDSTSPDSTPFIIDASGNVGIGIGTPENKLSISDSTAEYLMQLQRYGSTDGSKALIRFSNSSSANVYSSYIGSERETNAKGALVFGTNGTGGTGDNTSERMRITSSGLVGIGTTSPYAKLSVVGQTVSEYFTATSTTATSTLPNLSLTNLLFGSDYLTDITGTGLTVSNGALTVTGATISGAANMLAGFDDSGNLTSTSSPQVAYINATSTTATSTFAGGISGPGSFTVQSGSGYVGVGTTSPMSRLSLSGGNFTHVASGNPTLAGTYDTTGESYKVYISGKYAYVADQSSGLQIVDISNPNNPTLVGTYNTSGFAYGVYVSGKYAYVADGSSGLQIVDISDPTNPTLTGTYNTSGAAMYAYVSGKYAYVADQGSGLQIIDISNPVNPTLIGTYDTSGTAEYVYVSGKYAYVADSSSGLQIVDISDPTNPTLTGTYNTSGTAVGIYVSGKYAYVADSSSGLQIVDISDPTNPTLTGTYNTSSSAVDVYVSGKYAYVADFGSGLNIIDISNSADPVLVGTYNTSGYSTGVYVYGKYAYVADDTSGLQIIDINGIETPSLYAGNIGTNALTVTENVDIGNNLYARNGLNVGQGGIFTDGALSVSGTTTSSYFANNLGIGTTSPYAKLSVVGQVVGQYFTATSTTATSTLPNLSLTNLLFGSDYLTDITGTGLTVSNGALTVNGLTNSGFANMLAGFDASGNLTSTSSPQVAYINATSTTATSTFAGGISGPGSFTVQSSSGYVGIGTTTPPYSLSIQSNVSSTPTLGDELVTNGTFDTDLSGWTYSGDWSQSSGKATCSSVCSSTETISQSISAVAGMTYRFSFNLTINAGSLNISFLDYSNTFGTGGGTYTYYLTATTTGSQSFTFAPPSLFIGSIDNVTVKAITGTSSPSFAIFNNEGNTDSAFEIRTSATSLGNTYLGKDVGRLSLDSLQNTGVGFKSLYSDMGGNNNTALGYMSLYSNISGGNNTAQGAYSLYSNIGDTNTAQGAYSLYRNTTGTGNTAQGYGAMYNNSSATSSTAVGYMAGYGVSGQANQNNSLFGYKAGYGLSTGSNNILLGYQAGDAITTGSNNILIGYNIDATSTNSVNFLNIGNTIYGNTGTGNVGIGTTSPYAKFSVWGASTGTNRLFELTNSASTTLASFLENGTGYFLGNIGIGTTSPNWKLSVAGIGSFDDYVRASYFTATSTTATSTLPNLSLTRMLFGSDYLTDITGTGLTITNNALTVNGLTNSGFANMLAGFDASGNLTSTSSPQVAYINATSTTATSTFAGGISGPGSFTVQSSSGNVGIGTTSPMSKLSLSGGNFTHVASGNPTLVGTYNTAGNAKGVYISGKYAYVADDTSGLQIVDISNPASPTLTGTYNTAGNANGVYVSGKYAYVADDASGLQIVDISNPASPTLTGTYNTAGNAKGVYISGKYVYIADDTFGLLIVDISNPTNPTAVGLYNTSGNAYGVYILGKYAYVADAGFGLQIIDISNPTSPTLAGTYNTSGVSEGVYVSGKYAYIAGYDSGLQIIDISNPASPTLTGTYDTSGYAYGVYVSGKYAYVADTTFGIQIVDISNPTNPTAVGLYNTSGNAYGVYVSGKYAYVADDTSGLQIIDINGIETPSLYAGNINTNALTVTENGDIGNSLFVRNGLNVGQGGIFTDGALSVSGTTTSSYFANNLGIGTTSPYAKLSVVGQVVGQYFTATSTTASTFPYASTTALTVSGTNGLQLATGLTGPLQAINGLVSSTSTLSIFYGGTGTSTTPTYGQLLVGDGNGGYNLAATSTLGILASSAIGVGSAGFIPYYASGAQALTATSSIFISTKSYLGIGTTTPTSALSVFSASSPQFQLAYDKDNYLTAGVASNGGTTLAVNGTLGGLSITNPQPTVVGSGTGTDAPYSFSVIGAIGGNSADTNIGQGGVGGPIRLIGGVGGTSALATFSETGGAGGAVTVNGGVGGAASSPNIDFMTRLAGAGGALSFIAGAGGNASNGGTASSNTAGAGGAFVLKGGAGGNASGATTNNGGAGGSIYLSGGAGGTGSTVNGTAGNLYLGYDSSNAIGNVYFGNQSISYIGSTGNLGIGTTSPYAKLSVVGEVVGQYFTATSTATSTLPRLSVTGASADWFCFSGDCRTSWPTVAASATTTLLGDNNTWSGVNIFNGNIEINGTCTGTGCGGGSLSGGTAGMLTAWTSASAVTATGTPTAAAYTATSSTATSTFAGGMNVAGTSGLTVLQNGNVGVGTASPLSKLTIGTPSTAITSNAGTEALIVSTNAALNIAFAGENRQPTSSTGGSFAALYANDGSAVASGDRLGGFLIGGSSSGSAVRNSTLIAAFATENWVDASAYGSALAFETTSNGGTTRTEKLRITGNGNVGIGTTTPDATLTVLGSAYPVFRTIRTSGVTTGNVAAGTYQARSSGDMTDGFGIYNAFEIMDTAGVANVIGVTGFQRDGADNSGAYTVNTYTSGTQNERFRITNGGNIGIGTTSPYAKLSVVGPVVAEYIHATSTTATSIFAGKVGIGTVSPVTKLEINSLGSSPSSSLYSSGDTLTITGNTDTAAGFNIISGGSNAFNRGVFKATRFRGTAASPTTIASGDYTFSLLGAGYDGTNNLASAGINILVDSTVSTGVMPQAITFESGTSGTRTERMRITSGGLVGIATTSPWRTLSVTGTVALSGLTAETVSGSALCLSAGGEVQVNTGAQTCTVSSLRFKKDINDNVGGLGTVLSLKPSAFKYIYGNDEERVGFIAEDIQSVDPRLVVMDEDNLPRGVRYEDMTAVLVKSTQEIANVLSIASSTDNTFKSARLDQLEEELTSNKNLLASSTTALQAGIAGLSQSVVKDTSSSVQSLADAIVALDLKVDALIASSTWNMDLVIASTSATLASSTEFIAQISSSTVNVISSNPSFVEIIAKSVKDLVASAGEWVVDRFTAKVAYVGRVEAETVAISKGMEIVDQSTGSIWCVTIKNGEWNKVMGVCGNSTNSATNTGTTNLATNAGTTNSTTTNLVTNTGTTNTTASTSIATSSSSSEVSNSTSTSTPGSSIPIENATSTSGITSPDNGTENSPNTTPTPTPSGTDLPAVSDQGNTAVDPGAPAESAPANSSDSGNQPASNSSEQNTTSPDQGASSSGSSETVSAPVSSESSGPTNQTP